LLREWTDFVSAQEMAGKDDRAERGKAKEDEAEDGVDEAEEDSAGAVGNEANRDDERREPVIRPAPVIRIPTQGRSSPGLIAKRSQLEVTLIQ